MREVTTTRTGLILPPPVAQTLTGWLDQIAESEQPLDAAHAAASIAEAWLATTERPTSQPAHPAHADRQAVTARANPAAPTRVARPTPSRNPFDPTPSP
jgi:hypothetical protein